MEITNESPFRVDMQDSVRYVFDLYPVESERTKSAENGSHQLRFVHNGIARKIIEKVTLEPFHNASLDNPVTMMDVRDT